MVEAEATFRCHGALPPPWAAWGADQWRAHPEQARFCAEHQMGWDITDFGCGNYGRRGLLLLCTRNGIQGVAGERPYAEKLMIVREMQETPFHRHLVKVEDIINRGGGNLVIEVFGVESEQESSEPVTVLIDGALRTVAPREPIRLRPGESITLVPGQMHRFYGEAGHGEVLVGEVSQVNDDYNDNIFHEPMGRFATIEEDEPPRYPLWSELGALIGR